MGISNFRGCLINLVSTKVQFVRITNGCTFVHNELHRWTELKVSGLFFVYPFALDGLLGPFYILCMLLYTLLLDFAGYMIFADQNK